MQAAATRGVFRYGSSAVATRAAASSPLYLTNIPTEQLPPEDYRLEDMPSGKRDIVESLPYAAIFSLATSPRLLQVLREALPAQAQRLKEHRFATVLAFLADELLTLVLHRGQLAQHLQQRLSNLLLVEALDPNKSRPGLLQAIEDNAHQCSTRANRSRMYLH